MQSTNQGSIISVRTSDASYKTVSSGGGHTHSATQQSMVYHHDYNRANTWNHITLPVSSPTGKTTSFTTIHAEVALGITQSPQSITQRQNVGRGPGASDGEVSDDAIGQLRPGSPIGDMLLPLLAMAFCYIIIKLFRNRKISKAL